MTTVLKFSEQTIEEAREWLGQPDQQYLTDFLKAVFSIDGEGNRRIEITQSGYQHRLLLVDYDPATSDLILYLRTALKQLNNIIRNNSYLVPSTALGFETGVNNG